MTALVELARGTAGNAGPAAVPGVLAATADDLAVQLIEGFVLEAGPPTVEFAWVDLGSMARRELHCASDQDNALVWATEQAADSRYAAELAARVIAGLADFGLRRCAGGFMADKWSMGIDEWCAHLHRCVVEPTPAAVLDTDIFLDLRPIAGSLDTSAAVQTLLTGSDSMRLLHGLAAAATSFGVPLGLWGRIRGDEIDIKRAGLTPLVLMARLYGLRVRSAEVGTVGRLRDAGDAGLLGRGLTDDLVQAFQVFTCVRIERQLAQAAAGEALTDKVPLAALDRPCLIELRDALKAVKSAQDATAWTFRTDL